MNKSVKRYLALIMVFILGFSILSSCREDDNKNGMTTTSTDQYANSNDSTVEIAESCEVKLPLSEEKITLTMFAPTSINLTGLIDDLADTPFFKELEAKTNVHIEFQSPASGQESSAYNLMISSGELPDIIYNQPLVTYPDGLDAAVEDGYFLDLTELIPQYAPNYYKIINTMSDVVTKTTRTDSGKLVGVYQIATVPQGAYYGLQIREDWLNELGLSMPVTYSDWENVLTQFKEKKGASAPLMINSAGYNYDDGLSAGFNVTSSFMQIDGNISYGPIQEGWREYLTLMSDWYAKGLIDPDFMTQISITPDVSMVTSGKTGAWSSLYTLPSSLYLPTMEAGAMISPITEPIKTDGDKLHIRVGDFTVFVYYTISKDCEYPEIALKWMDYLFSETGTDFANYGIEGETFEYVDGKPQFTEMITKNPDGLSFNQACSYYAMPPAMPVFQDWTRELQIVPEKDILSFDVWGVADTDYLMPTGISMTSQENVEYARIMADVTSYVNENTVLFITGVRPVAEFDDYVAAIKEMGIDRAVEIQQASLDRYISR